LVLSGLVRLPWREVCIMWEKRLRLTRSCLRWESAQSRQQRRLDLQVGSTQIRRIWWAVW
jgi:hypothetical protein